MGKVLTVAAAIIAILAAPLLAALVIAGIAVPAARATVPAVCAGVVPTAGAWRVPFVQAYIVSSRGIGWSYHPVFKRWNFHGGQDMSTLPGPGPIVAANTGRVIRAGWDTTGYGNTIDLQHAGGITTRYAHLASIDPAITVGATVQAGQRLGVEGTTGASTGPHLHFEIAVHGQRVNPLTFMREHGAPLDGHAPTATPTRETAPKQAQRKAEAIVPVAGPKNTAALPPPGEPRRNSLHNPALPIPPDILTLYVAAGNKYGIPWPLLAGIGMEETAHGRITGTSTAGAQGIMQFLPATWATMGVDGNGDGRADITDLADSIYSAANYLTHEGARSGTDGIRQALYAYNHATWYVNDVLYYATGYQADQPLSLAGNCPMTFREGDAVPKPRRSWHTARSFFKVDGAEARPVDFGAQGEPP